jgi:hypothetical protein
VKPATSDVILFGRRKRTQSNVYFLGKSGRGQGAIRLLLLTLNCQLEGLIRVGWSGTAGLGEARHLVSEETVIPMDARSGRDVGARMRPTCIFLRSFSSFIANRPSARRPAKARPDGRCQRRETTDKSPAQMAGPFLNCSR